MAGAESASDPRARSIAAAGFIAAISTDPFVAPSATGDAGADRRGALFKGANVAGFGLGDSSRGASGSAEVHVALSVGSTDCLGGEVHRASTLAAGGVRVREGSGVRGGKRGRQRKGGRQRRGERGWLVSHSRCAGDLAAERVEGRWADEGQRQVGVDAPGLAKIGIDFSIRGANSLGHKVLGAAVLTGIDRQGKTGQEDSKKVELGDHYKSFRVLF